MTISIPAYAACVLKRLESFGHEAYVVGGCVRDTLLGKTPKDWDITTSCTPEETMKALEGIHVIETGIQHGTVTAVVDREPVEITTFRIDGAYTDHRRPDQVLFTRNLTEDLARRDFTINAMAYAPSQGLIDPFGGEADLQNGLIRCVGTPEKRFEEDALRIMRAVRFSAVLGFEIAPDTVAAMRKRMQQLSFVSAERICAELSKLICANYADKTLSSYGEILEQVLPAVPRPYPKVGGVPPQLVLRLAVFFSRIEAEAAQKLLVDLRFDNTTCKTVCTLLQNIKLELFPNLISIRKALSVLGEPILTQLITIRTAIGEDLSMQKSLLQKVLEQGDCYSIRQLAVNGVELGGLGFKGPEIGGMLTYLLNMVMEEKLENQKDILLRAAKRYSLET